jgi:hypothetical protein
MTVLVSIETAILVLLGILVAGLLRSHAEILHRLEELAGTTPHPAPATPVDPSRLPARADVRAGDLSGVTPRGDAVAVSLTGGPRGTLLAFLSSGCASCGVFWDALGRGEAIPGELRAVVVTHGPDQETAAKLRPLAAPDLLVVMSSAAWERYAVPMTPYFVLVDAAGRIAGEGVAPGWDQLASLIRDALEEHEPAPSSNGHGGAARSTRADDELRAAGIGPGHPSLYGPVEGG